MHVPGTCRLSSPLPSSCPCLSPLPPSRICGQRRYRASAADTRDAGFNYLSNVDVAHWWSSFTAGEGRPAFATSSDDHIAQKASRFAQTSTEERTDGDYLSEPLRVWRDGRDTHRGVDGDGDGDGDQGGKEKCGNGVQPGAIWIGRINNPSGNARGRCTWPRSLALIPTKGHRGH